METNTTAAATDTTTPTPTTTTTEPTPTPNPAPTPEAGTPAPTPIVPEKYDIKVGEDSPIDNAYLDAFQSYAKEQKLTQEEASKLFNREQFAVSEYLKRSNVEFEQMKSQWVESVKKDPEIGGDNYAANVELAHRALEKYGTPQFKQELESSGFGNHPELVRIFARIGKSLADDKFVSPGAVSGGKKSYEDIFYGKS